MTLNCKWGTLVGKFVTIGSNSRHLKNNKKYKIRRIIWF